MPEKILVIEDDHMIAQALHARLSAVGFAVVVAHDGECGIHAADRNFQKHSKTPGRIFHTPQTF